MEPKKCFKLSYKKDVPIEPGMHFFTTPEE